MRKREKGERRVEGREGEARNGDPRKNKRREKKEFKTCECVHEKTKKKNSYPRYWNQTE